MSRLRPWMSWALLVTAFAAAQFHRVTPATVGGAVMADLSIGAGTFGLIASMYFYAYMVLMVPGGVLADLYGPRKVVTLGCVVAASGALLFATAHTLPLAILGRLLIGGGVAAMFPCVLRFQQDCLPPQLVGRLTGIVVASTTAASLLAYTPLAILIQSFGWRSSHALMAAATLTIGLLVWVLVRERPEAREAQGDVQQHHGSTWQEMRLRIAAVLSNRHSWPPFLIQAGNYGSLIAFSGVWAVPYLMEVYGIDLVIASASAQIPLIGMSVGSLLIGWLSDRFRTRRSLAMMFGIVLVGCWSWIVIGTLPHPVLIVLFLIMGLTGGVIVTTVAAVSEVNPPALAGVAASVAGTGGIVGAAIFQPLMGWLLDHEGASPDGFRLAFLVGLMGSILAAISACLLRETRGQNVYTSTELAGTIKRGEHSSVVAICSENTRS